MKKIPLRLALTLLALQACTIYLNPAAEPGAPALPGPDGKAASQALAAPAAEPTGAALAPPPVLLPLGEGLIPNGDLEKGTVGQPEGWVADGWDSRSTALTWEEGDALSGRRYLSTKIPVRKPVEGRWFFAPRQLEPGKWYQYRNFYRSDSRGRMLVMCQDAATQRRTFASVWQSDPATLWTPSGFRFYLDPAENCQTSVLHTIDQPGWLHSDRHELVEVAPQPLGRPQVSITFDDVWASAVDTGAAELEKRGLKGSFYLTSRFVQRPEEQFAGKERIDKLIAAGHEIGSHSDNHKPLSQMDTNSIVNEMRESRTYLKALGVEAQGMAYPFGDFSGQVEIETRRFFAYARTSLKGLNDAQADLYRLRILPVTSETSTAEIKRWVDAAARTSTWLILLFHDLNDAPADPEYTTPATQYREILDYVQAQNLAVVTVAEGLKQLRP